MPEVHVVFPPEGPPIVSHETQACVHERFVTWHIRSENPKIEQVLLEFERPKDKFFSGLTWILAEMNPYTRPKQHDPDKKPKPHDPNKKPKPSRSHQMVWGQAPYLDVKEKKRTSKYTVYGLNSDSEEVPGASLDPMILITKDP